jgi:hypothetical protein
MESLATVARLLYAARAKYTASCHTSRRANHAEVVFQLLKASQPLTRPSSRSRFHQPSQPIHPHPSTKPGSQVISIHP